MVTDFFTDPEKISRVKRTIGLNICGFNVFSTYQNLGDQILLGKRMIPFEKCDFSHKKFFRTSLLDSVASKNLWAFDSDAVCSKHHGFSHKKFMHN